MRKTGHVVLPLHGGHAPQWLVKRMKSLSYEVVRLISREYGAAVFLSNLSDPYWFQAFGCVLGFDWHSSGLTTVVTGVLKDVLNIEDHGVVMAGGKGKASRRTQPELGVIGNQLNLSTSRIEELKYSSRMCAKVDTACIQAGYPIYHHAFFLAEGGEWCVIQQGINAEDRSARRYHWLSEGLENFVVEPHSAIVGDSARPDVLNMTAREAEENRKITVDLVREKPSKLISSIKRLDTTFLSLDHWIDGVPLSPSYKAYVMPRDLDWKLFDRLYDTQPSNYEELIATKGVGPAAVRALALVAELIYGAHASWRDPVKYSYAHGGKDGVPYPVNRKVMDESIRMLKDTVDSIEVGEKDKVAALRRLAILAESWGASS